MATSLTLLDGETRTITAKIKPYDATNKLVMWNTSDNKIVMLSGGKTPDDSYEVTLYAGTQLGTAEVKAIVYEFPYLEEGKKFENAITVKVAGEGEVLANFDLPWYKPGFNIGEPSHCPWYVHGRVAEVHGLRISFIKTPGTPGISGGDGGWWTRSFNFAEIIKNDGKGSWITNSQGGPTLTPDELNARKATNVRIETDPTMIKPKSVASFLFHVSGDYYGHVVFIEDVRIDKDGEKYVYFTDSNAGFGEGVVVKIEFSKFIKLFGETQTYDNTGVFQGYIQFD